MKFLSIASILFFFLSCSSPQNPSVKVLDSTAFKTAISGKIVNLIDVRTPEEYSQGTIKYAVNINYKGENFLKGFKDYKKDEAVYIFCQSGGRSGKAAEVLSEAGFKEIYDLDGGYSGWE